MLFCNTNIQRVTNVTNSQGRSRGPSVGIVGATREVRIDVRAYKQVVAMHELVSLINSVPSQLLFASLLQWLSAVVVVTPRSGPC